jgi:iron complex transport system permease protein
MSLLLSVSSGVLAIPALSSLQALAVGLGFPIEGVEPQHQLVLWMIRWPRALLAAFVGATLALCGSAMQGLFRNPLADPSLIGVSSGASLGASIAIVLGATIFSDLGSIPSDYAQLMATYSVSIFACTAGFITTLLVYKLGSSTHGTSVTTMLLAGIAISALAAAATNIFSYIADDVSLRRISLWQMGNLGGADWSRVLVSITLLGTVLLVLPRYGKVLNTFLLGESEARHLGVNVQRMKIQLIAWTALGVGVAVSVAGIVGFVGLVVPHLIRLMIGPDHRNLMPASALLGAVLLILADWLSRTLFAPAEIPIGILTALLGAPFFISLLVKQKRHMAGQ